MEIRSRVISSFRTDSHDDDVCGSPHSRPEPCLCPEAGKFTLHIERISLYLVHLSLPKVSVAESRQMNISETQKCYVYGQCQVSEYFSLLSFELKRALIRGFFF